MKENKNMKEKTSFSAIVELPNAYCNEEVTVDIELDKDIDHLTYDEVEDAIYTKTIKEHGISEPDVYDNDDYDDADFCHIINIVINEKDGESYPVISESMDDSKLKSSKTYSKFLVLPDALYSLSPECKLFMQLKEQGIIDEDAAFDYDKYHKILEENK